MGERRGYQLEIGNEEFIQRGIRNGKLWSVVHELVWKE